MNSSTACEITRSVTSTSAHGTFASVPNVSTMTSLPHGSDFNSAISGSTYGANRFFVETSSSCERFRTTFIASGSRRSIALDASASNPRVPSAPTTASQSTSAHRGCVVRFTTSAMSSGAACRSET